MTDRISPFLRRLVDRMAADGVPDPLLQRVTLATVIYDILEDAGEDVPADVLVLVDPPRPEREGVARG